MATNPVSLQFHPKKLFSKMRLVYEGNNSKVYVSTLECGNRVVVKKLQIQSSLLLQTYVDLEVAMSMLCANSPFIVKALFTTRTSDNVWLVMEFMEHGSLSSFLLNSIFNEREIAYVLRHVLCGLLYLHRRHRIHRDIKANNIFVNADCEVKLADFGWTVQLTESQTKTFLKVGSVFWMAPEVHMSTW
jgi:p21-activated kinase 1